MSGHDVSRVVASILSAFNNGMNLFRQMAGKDKSKKQKTEDFTPSDELQLQNSLQQRPKEIQGEYDRGVSRLGYRFEIGDSIAQTSLAHTLMVLNTGLLSIINKALSNDSRKRESSKRALLSMSEVAAVDALHALAQLDYRLSTPRLTASPQLTLPAATGENGSRRAVKSTEQQAKQRVASKAAKKVVDVRDKRPVPSPLLARGGWIRSKSNSMVLSASTSRSNLARPAHERSKSSPAVPKAANPPTSRRGSKNEDDGGKTCTTSLASSKGEPEQRPAPRRALSSPGPHDESPKPAPNLFNPHPMDMPGDSTSNSRLPKPAHPPPVPPKIPLHSRPMTAAGVRIRPPSVATFMTASTKIGEIPEHRWPRQHHHHHRRNHRPGEDVSTGPESTRLLPYIIPPPLNPEEMERVERKLKGGGARGFIKFWKRTERNDNNGKSVLAF